MRERLKKCFRLCSFVANNHVFTRCFYMVGNDFELKKLLLEPLSFDVI